MYLLQLPCGSAFISPLPRWSQISTPHKPVLWGPKSTARFYSDLRTSGGSSTHIAVLFYNLDNLGNPDLITSIQHGKHNNNNHRANSSSHRYPSIYIYSREKYFAVCALVSSYLFLQILRRIGARSVYIAKVRRGGADSEGKQQLSKHSVPLPLKNKINYLALLPSEKMIIFPVPFRYRFQ